MMNFRKREKNLKYVVLTLNEKSLENTLLLLLHPLQAVY